eukprot:COSAG01_NODE_9516_length_2422_cov_1.343521_4_plen_40_part_01
MRRAISGFAMPISRQKAPNWDWFINPPLEKRSKDICNRAS